MGRKKIEMKPILDKKNRKDTFHKRKVGLIKKAAELSILCNVRMLLVFEDLSGDIIKYSTHGVYDPVQYFSESYTNAPIAFTARHYPDFFKNVTTKKEMKDEDGESGGRNDYYEESDDDDNEENIATADKASAPGFQPYSEVNLTAYPQPSEFTEKTKTTNYLYQQLQQQQMQAGGYLTVPSNQRLPPQQQWQKPQQMQQQTNQYYTGGQGNYAYNQYDKSQNQQWRYEKNMDLEVIVEREGDAISTIPQVDSSRNTPQFPSSKLKSFKKEFNPRLRVSEEIDELRKPFPANLVSPNPFTPSPIGYANISPITVNANSFLYEFNDSAIMHSKGFNMLRSPMTGKSAKNNGTQRPGIPSFGSLVLEQQGESGGNSAPKRKRDGRTRSYLE